MKDCEPTAIARKTMPSQSLLQGKPYVRSESTDIRATFAAIKAAQTKPKRAPKLVAAR